MDKLIFLIVDHLRKKYKVYTVILKLIVFRSFPEYFFRKDLREKKDTRLWETKFPREDILRFCCEEDNLNIFLKYSNNNSYKIAAEYDKIDFLTALKSDYNTRKILLIAMKFNNRKIINHYFGRLHDFILVNIFEYNNVKTGLFIFKIVNCKDYFILKALRLKKYEYIFPGTNILEILPLIYYHDFILAVKQNINKFKIPFISGKSLFFKLIPIVNSLLDYAESKVLIFYLSNLVELFNCLGLEYKCLFKKEIILESNELSVIFTIYFGNHKFLKNKGYKKVYPILAKRIKNKEALIFFS